MKILMAGWDSGDVAAVQTVVRRAVRRGHHVRAISRGEGNWWEAIPAPAA